MCKFENYCLSKLSQRDTENTEILRVTLCALAASVRVLTNRNDFINNGSWGHEPWRLVQKKLMKFHFRNLKLNIYSTDERIGYFFSFY
jgi:hypothetical protein